MGWATTCWTGHVIVCSGLQYVGLRWQRVGRPWPGLPVGCSRLTMGSVYQVLGSHILRGH
jgi:hypothetical protein